MEIENLLKESDEVEEIELLDSELKLIDRVIQEFAPELSESYQFREDETEEQKVKMGQLHENRILGIFLKFYLGGRNKITTLEVEEEYKRYFKFVARSTTSTYLNMLKKESILYKERDGRKIKYIFSVEPPLSIKPFWFTRIFCTVPAYFSRALLFCFLYINAEYFVRGYIKNNENINEDLLMQNFKSISGIIILKIFKNRTSKCILCQFSKSNIYNKLEKMIDTAIKDRTDVLSEDLLSGLIEKCSEIPVFNGINIDSNEIQLSIANEITRIADTYKKDLGFQAMVSLRRQDLRLKQKMTLKEHILSIPIEEKVERS